jgi:uncharacterized protein YodC (DUF2158 family)
MPGFNKGDLVQLKSGGPKMVVSDTGDYTPMGPEDGVNCVWFDGKKSSEKVFDAATLKPWKDDLENLQL